MSIETNRLRFLKGADLSGVDTHDPRAGTSTKAAPRQTIDQFTLPGTRSLLTSPGVNHRSLNADRFASAPAVTEDSLEPSMSEIFNPEGTARLSKDLFMEGVRQSEPVISDEPGEIANMGNLLLAMFNQAQKNSNLS